MVARRQVDGGASEITRGQYKLKQNHKPRRDAHWVLTAMSSKPQLMKVQKQGWKRSTEWQFLIAPSPAKRGLYAARRGGRKSRANRTKPLQERSLFTSCPGTAWSGSSLLMIQTFKRYLAAMKWETAFFQGGISTLHPMQLPRHWQALSIPLDQLLICCHILFMAV